MINVAAINEQIARNVELRKSIDKKNTAAYQKKKENENVTYTAEQVNEMFAGNKMMKDRFKCVGFGDKGFAKLERIDFEPYHCECCQRMHHNAQTWLWMRVANGKLMVGCRRSTGEKKFLFIEKLD
jgi:hypothetical protein